MKRIIALLSVCAVLLGGGSIAAQPITTFEEESVEYQLPYPGILVDNPLYFVKSIRNRLLIMFASSSLDKAQEYLNQSNKKLAMAEPLREKGKIKRTVGVVEDANDLFQKAVEQYKMIEDRPEEKPALLEELKIANRKHRQVIEDLLKNIPQGELESIEDLREENIAIGEELSQLE
ncbi:MAG: DUF5667 domain-containing protein [Patescibacteria group bacterium]